MQWCRLPHTHCNGMLKWHQVYSVTIFTSRASMFIFHSSVTVRAGLDTSKSNTSKWLPSAIFYLLLGSLHVQVNSLVFVTRNFHPCSTYFISQHVANAVHLQQQSASSKNATWREKESKSSIRKREKKQKMARLLEVGSQW